MLAISPSNCPDMTETLLERTETLLKRTKNVCDSSIHPRRALICRALSSMDRKHTEMFYFYTTWLQFDPPYFSENRYFV